MVTIKNIDSTKKFFIEVTDAERLSVDELQSYIPHSTCKVEFKIVGYVHDVHITMLCTPSAAQTPDRVWLKQRRECMQYLREMQEVAESDYAYSHNKSLANNLSVVNNKMRSIDNGRF